LFLIQGIELNSKDIITPVTGFIVGFLKFYRFVIPSASQYKVAVTQEWGFLVSVKGNGMS